MPAGERGQAQVVPGLRVLELLTAGGEEPLGDGEVLLGPPGRAECEMDEPPVRQRPGFPDGVTGAA